MPAPYTDEQLIIDGLLPSIELIHTEFLPLLEEIRDLLQKMEEKSTSSVPKASLLVNEYMGNQDLDGNGLVYGKDFHIDAGDTDKPPMLTNFPNEGTAMLWADYLASV